METDWNGDVADHPDAEERDEQGDRAVLREPADEAQAERQADQEPGRVAERDDAVLLVDEPRQPGAEHDPEKRAGDAHHLLQGDLLRRELEAVDEGIGDDHPLDPTGDGQHHPAGEHGNVRAVAEQSAQVLEEIPEEAAVALPRLVRQGRELLVQVRDLVGRRQGAGQDRGGDEHAADDGEPLVARGVQQSIVVLVGGREDDHQHEGRQRDAADVHDHPVPREDRRAFVVVVGQLGAERGVRDGVEGLGDAQEHEERGEPEEEAELGQFGRLIQAVEADPERQRREEHERVTPAPARAHAVGQRPDRRVGHGVDDARDQERGTAERRRDAEDLVVEEHRRDAGGADHRLFEGPRRERELRGARELAVASGSVLSSGLTHAGALYGTA